MNIKRFLAKSSREALNMVRNELGEDASIISNRQVDGWNEILAVHGHEMDELISNSHPTPETTPTAWIPKVEIEATEAQIGRAHV